MPENPIVYALQRIVWQRRRFIHVRVHYLLEETRDEKLRRGLRWTNFYFSIGDEWTIFFVLLERLSRIVSSQTFERLTAVHG